MNYRAKLWLDAITGWFVVIGMVVILCRVLYVLSAFIPSPGS